MLLNCLEAGMNYSLPKIAEREHESARMTLCTLCCFSCLPMQVSWIVENVSKAVLFDLGITEAGSIKKLRTLVELLCHVLHISYLLSCEIDVEANLRPARQHLPRLGLISSNRKPPSCRTWALWCWWGSVILLAGGPYTLHGSESLWMGLSTGWQEGKEVLKAVLGSGQNHNWITSMCVCAWV